MPLLDHNQLAGLGNLRTLGGCLSETLRLGAEVLDLRNLVDAFPNWNVHLRQRLVQRR